MSKSIQMEEMELFNDKQMEKETEFAFWACIAIRYPFVCSTTDKSFKSNCIVRCWVMNIAFHGEKYFHFQGAL